MDNQNISNLPIDAILSEFLKEEEQQQQQAAPEEQVQEEVQENLTDNPVESKNSNDRDEDFFSLIDDKFFKTNKLTPFNNEDGSDYVIPKSLDEFAELLDANKEHWVNESRYQQKEEVLADIFKETTPAFQFLAQNANQFKTVEEMLPLIQSVQAQDDLDALDVTDETHQEYIVRYALALQGFDEKTIDAEIEDAKERNKLESKALTLKPALDRVQADKTQRLLEEQALKNQEDQKFWNNYYTSLNEKLINSKDLDGMVLKQEDKVRVANNLIPSSDGTGLPLYSKIDELVGKGDAVTLSIISMLVEDKALFDSLYANKTHIEAGKSSARTLRTGLTSKTSEEDVKPKQQKAKTVDAAKSYGVFL